MELLFEHSGNPDGDEYSTTLICLALEEGHDNVLKVLLDHGADIFLAQAQDDEADHLMDQIIKRGKLELIQAFLERDMSFQDTETSERPASIVEAARQGEAIFGLLLQHGIKLEPGRIEHQKALANAACQVDVESRDPSPESGNPSLLAMVATANNREAAETAMGLLLARGVDIEALEPKTQLTSLLYLCSRMSPNLCRARNDHLRLKALGVRLLLDKGANLLFKNKHNTSAFILAAHGGDRSIVKIMLGFWEEQGLPFDWIKDHVLMGTSTNDPEMAKLLWHYYWPHVYPVEK
jgi:ankyrin repeat protein